MENLKTKGAVAVTVLALGGLAGVALASNKERVTTDPSAGGSRGTIDRPEMAAPEKADSDADRDHPEATGAERGAAPAVTSSSEASGDDDHDQKYEAGSDDHDDSGESHDSDEEHDDDDD